MLCPGTSFVPYIISSGMWSFTSTLAASPPVPEPHGGNLNMGLVQVQLQCAAISWVHDAHNEALPFQAGDPGLKNSNRIRSGTGARGECGPSCIKAERPGGQRNGPANATRWTSKGYYPTKHRAGRDPASPNALH